MLQVANRRLIRAVFSLPPVERNEDIFFSNTDFDEPTYCTSRPQSRGLQHADRSSNDITSVEAQGKFRSRSDSDWVKRRMETCWRWNRCDLFGATMLKVRLRLFHVTSIYCAFLCFSSLFFVLTDDQFIHFVTYLASSIIFSSFICAILVGQVLWISSERHCNILMREVLSIEYNLSGWKNKKDFNKLTYPNEAMYTKQSYLIIYLKQI